MSNYVTDRLREKLGKERLESALKFTDSWLVESAFLQISENRESVYKTLTQEEQNILRDALDVLELQALDRLLEGLEESKEDQKQELREICSAGFRLMRTLELPQDPLLQLKHLIKLTCLAILGEKTVDVRRWLKERSWSASRGEKMDWDVQVFMSIGDSFLKVVRKDGWKDLEDVATNINMLREKQKEYERGYLEKENTNTQAAALELVSLYHLAKAIEDLGTYYGNGEPGPEKILRSLEFHFSRSLKAAVGARIPEWEVLLHWMHAAFEKLAKDAIWWQLRAYNHRLTQYKKILCERKIFDLLPPQQEAIQEVMNMANRSVVIELPTSGGKTLLAEFRILQAKNNFPDGWVAYLVPTRALVNQVSLRLQKDLGELDIYVRTATPAFEIDIFEKEMFSGKEHFDVLVTTPEKLDLLIRGEYFDVESKPLSLVILDEAHNISEDSRGLHSELLLSTINNTYEDVQFLLLSPFVPNSEELAAWLDPDRSKAIKPVLSAQWLPNDRAIAICSKEGNRKNWYLTFESVHTTKPSIKFENVLALEPRRIPLNLPASRVNSKLAISAAAAKLVSRRGTCIILSSSPKNAWQTARLLGENLPDKQDIHENVRLVQRFLKDEFGDDFELISLLSKGIGVHHGGLSHEIRYLMEWLIENKHIDILVATTTLAQGINFPITSVIFASHRKYIRRRTVDLSPEEFWNIAGRTGRLFQDTLGLVILSARNAKDRHDLIRFVNTNVESLVSSLENMIKEIIERGWALNLRHLVKNDPRWSNLVQYLSHSYRQINNHARFVQETEEILKGTFGYQRLQRENPRYAEELLNASRSYAEDLQEYGGGTLSLVDATGFSPETITELLQNKDEITLSVNQWRVSNLFSKGGELTSLFGRVLKINEIDIKPLPGTTHEFLSNVVRDWVLGRPLEEITRNHFLDKPDRDITQAITECCRLLFQRLLHGATWSIGAFQTLSDIPWEKLSKEQQEELRTIPAMIFYGVDTVEGVLMRMLNVPRSVAKKAGEGFKRSVGKEKQRSTDSAHEWLKNLSADDWERLKQSDSPLSGNDLRNIWRILNGVPT
jgi:superfamily II DNA/RNA helicase